MSLKRTQGYGAMDKILTAYKDLKTIATVQPFSLQYKSLLEICANSLAFVYHSAYQESLC